MEESSQDEKEIYKKSPYDNWYQFNNEHGDDIIWLARNYPKAQLILQFFLIHMDAYNTIECPYETLMEALDISESTVVRSIGVLKEHGFIHINKSGVSNVYIVNPKLAWSSWGTNIKYSKFPAATPIQTPGNTGKTKGVGLKATKHKKVRIDDKPSQTKRLSKNMQEPTDDDIDDFIDGLNQ